MAVIQNVNKIDDALRRAWRNAGAPVSGTTLAGVADPGDLLIDTTNVMLFQNINTKASPTWAQVAVAGVTVTGDFTITGDITIDANDINLGDNDDLEFGDGQDTVMRWSTADASNHAFVIGLDNTSQQMHITDKAAVATDWGRSAGTHPELAIHSNTTPITDYLAIGNHDGTTAHIDVVGGTTLSLDIAGTAEVLVTANSTHPATSDSNALGTTSNMWSDLFLASGAVINFNNGNQTITHDPSWTYPQLVITQKVSFGGYTDWGTGATGTVIAGDGYDWVTQTIGRVNANLNNTAAAAAYHAITVTANQTGSNSIFGTWTELYIANSVDLTGADNFAPVWGQFEAGTGVTLSDTGCFTAGGYFNVKAGATLTIATGHTVNGVRVQAEISAATNNGRLAAFECLKSGGIDWQHGLYLADVTTGITIPDGATTGISIGDSTTGIAITGDTTDAIKTSGTNTDGIEIAGTVSNAINVSGTATKILQFGSYSSMATHQNSELITLAATDTTGWILGLGVYMRATGTDGYPFAGMFYVESTDTTGTDRMNAIQAMAFLGTTTGSEAAHLKTLGGDAVAGMYSIWAKIGGNTNCVADSGSRMAPLWIDNQFHGTASGEEYAMFITCGGSKVDAVIGLVTTSSGWTYLLSFDETSYDQDPIFSTGTCKVDATKDSTGTIKINLNGTTYYMGYWAAADLTS